MIRVSVTTLEAFRRLVEEDGDEHRLYASIARPDEIEPTWQMRAGTVWDSLMTDKVAYETALALGEDPVELDGFLLRKEDIITGWECVPAEARGVSQLKVREVVPSCLGPVRVVGKVDLFWDKAYELKTRYGGSFDPGDYDSSVQWRWYLALTGTEECCYLVYQFDATCLPRRKGLSLQTVHRDSYFRYNGMQETCQEYLDRFLQWAKRHKLLGHLARPQSIEEMLP